MRSVLVIAYDLLNKHRPPRENDIVIFDIDDTLIDITGEPLYDVVEFYRYVRMIGFKTVIITAREGAQENINVTMRALQNIGISDYHRIYFRDASQLDVEQYKLNSRKKLFLDGFNAVMSIGDMNWDTGLYGGIGIII
jgi:FMN phosphatase YigB (HAD superfamily)